MTEVNCSFIGVHVEMKICNYLICSSEKKKKEKEREGERKRERKRERKKNVIKRNMLHHYQHHCSPPQWAYLFLVTMAQVSFSCWWPFYIELSLCNKNSGNGTWQHLHIKVVSFELLRLHNGPTTKWGLQNEWINSLT